MERNMALECVESSGQLWDGVANGGYFPGCANATQNMTAGGTGMYMGSGHGGMMFGAASFSAMVSGVIPVVMALTAVFNIIF